MADNRNKSNNVSCGAGGGDAMSSTGPPANDFELKNLLIDLVKEQPLIYDKAHKDHFRANMRTEVFHDIGNILGIPGKCLYYTLFYLFATVLYSSKHVMNTMYCRTCVRKKMEGSCRHLSKKG